MSLLRNKAFWLITIIWFALAAICYHLIDFRFMLYLHNSRPQWLISVMDRITMLGKGWFAAAITIILGTIAYINKNAKRFKQLTRLLIAIILSGIICNIFKIILGRARPEMWFKHHMYGFYFFKTNASMWSFPSGHCTTAATFFVGLAILYPRFKWMWLTLMILVAISRFTLLHHYVSDTMIGLWLGTFVVLTAASIS